MTYLCSINFFKLKKMSAIELIQAEAKFFRFSSGDENNTFLGSYWLLNGQLKTSPDRFNVDTVNDLISQCIREKGKISDGYHSFDELYEHRCSLFIALCNSLPSLCHKTKKNFEKHEWHGWFILAMNHPDLGQMSYHIPNKYWDDVRVNEVEFNYNYDGHSSSDVLERLKKL